MKTRSIISSFLAATGVSVMLGVTGASALVTETDSARLLLASELPPGITLNVASPEQVILATRKAVRREPRRAVKVVRAAIFYKVPPRRAAPVESKNVVDRSKDVICPPCAFIVEVVHAAIQANPEEASAVIEEASSLCPGCAGDLQALLNDPGLALGDLGGDNLGGIFGFGFGLGPGFPGAPSFTGFPTGGVLALPPTGNALTPVENN